VTQNFSKQTSGFSKRIGGLEQRESLTIGTISDPDHRFPRKVPVIDIKIELHATFLPEVSLVGVNVRDNVDHRVKRILNLFES